MDGYFKGRVSLIISAYNEENVIKERIENIANQSINFDNLEALVGSDGSSDNTPQYLIELSQKYKWLKVFSFEERRGKGIVLNELVTHADGEILIFSDANTLFDNSAIKNIISNFSDKKIGGVCGKLILTNKLYKKSGSADEKKYWQYETFIKKAEGDCGILIGANGGIYAIRRKLFSILPEDSPVTDDLFISMSVLLKNYKFIFNEKACAYEEIAPKLLHEFKRKIRFGATNLETLKQLNGLFRNKNILLVYAFWSHKLSRWFMPFFLLTLFISNSLLFGVSNILDFVLFLQLCFYIISCIGFILSILNFRVPILSLPFFFILTNVALFIGFVKFITKKHSATWQSTPR
jgi:cellulose synthase/poly-beta-1,6-N-acetylglucosamine synthase-like glycosyltransferase